MDKLVSVITVTYNSGDGLRRTCESVGSQTHASVEHIIIDGGSDDVSAEFLKVYAVHDSVKASSGPDRGIFDAMNKGLALATGDLIVFMNAADTFGDERTLSSVVESFTSEGWEWAYGSVRYVDSLGAPLGVVTRNSHQQRMLELGLTFVPHQTMYVSSKLAGKVGLYDESLDMAADQDFAIRAGLIHQPKIISEVLCNFEVGGAHGKLGRVERELIFHQIRRKNHLMILGNQTLDKVFAVLNGARWALRDLAVTVVRGTRADR